MRNMKINSINVAASRKFPLVPTIRKVLGGPKSNQKNFDELFMVSSFSFYFNINSPLCLILYKDISTNKHHIND